MCSRKLSLDRVEKEDEERPHDRNKVGIFPFVFISGTGNICPARGTSYETIIKINTGTVLKYH
jgi:hypothetical protein